MQSIVLHGRRIHITMLHRSRDCMWGTLMAGQQLTALLVLCVIQVAGVYVLGVESSCTNGFSSNSILMDTNIQSTSDWSTIGEPKQWVFPSINFTCNETRIIGWVFRATYNNLTGSEPILMQIWRYDEIEGIYRKVRSSGSLKELVSPGNQVHGQSYVYEYNLTSPITAEKNDLFGLEWAYSLERTQLEMWDVGDGNAPISYRVQANFDRIDPATDHSTPATDHDHRFLPLVSIIIDSLSSTTTIALMPSPSLQTPGPMIPTMTSTVMDEKQTIPAAAIAGTIIGVLVVVGVVAVIVIIIVCVLRKKNKGNRRRSTTDRHTMSSEEVEMMTTTPYTAAMSTIPTAYNAESISTQENVAYSNRTVDETIPTEENVAYAVDETIPTEENAAYGNRTVDKTIPTEENAGTVCRDRHSRATATLADELNEDSAIIEYDYIDVRF